jgi:hypothetical protein
VERGDGAIAGTIRVVDRRPVDRLAAFPSGELLGIAERFAVADHADDIVVRWHLAFAYKHLEGPKNQICLARMGVNTFVASRGCPLFAEALDAPGVDELVHPFGLISDLRVSLAAMNDLDAELVGQVVELLRLGVVRDLLRLRATELLVRQGLPSEVKSACLVKWLIRPRLPRVRAPP